MVVTMNNETKSHGLLMIGCYLLVAALCVWFPLRRLLATVFAEKYFFIVTISLCFLGVLLLILSIVVHIFRARSMSVQEATRYLSAFARQYDTSVNTDIANCVSAILVLEEAGLFKADNKTKKKRIGTVKVYNEELTTDNADNTITTETKQRSVTNNVQKLQKSNVQQKSTKINSTEQNSLNTTVFVEDTENVELLTLDENEFFKEKVSEQPVINTKKQTVAQRTAAQQKVLQQKPVQNSAESVIGTKTTANRTTTQNNGSKLHSAKKKNNMQ